jgi:hypothetical protein
MANPPETDTPPFEPLLRQLEERITLLSSRNPSAVANIIALHFAWDVKEQLSAVEALLPLPGARAAFANARAAVEGALDLAYLLCDAAEFPQRAALARVAELFEFAEAATRGPQSPAERETSARLVKDAEDSALEAAKVWEQLDPGSGILVRRAVELISKELPIRRRHWSGVASRVDLATTVFAANDPNLRLAEQFSAVEGVLAIHSHPRPRMGQRELSWSTEGHVDMKTSAADLDLIRSAAMFAASLAVESLANWDTWRPT